MLEITLGRLLGGEIAAARKAAGSLPPDLQEIRLTVYRHPQNSQRAWYEARAVVHLPTGTLAAEATNKDPRAVLDRVAETLVKEIKRHKERVRHDYVFKRKARDRADLSAAGPLLERDAEIGRRETSSNCCGNASLLARPCPPRATHP